MRRPLAASHLGNWVLAALFFARRVLSIAAALLCASMGWPGDVAARPATKVFLNGVASPVFFNDGDSFTVLGGPYAGTKARLAGYNTLESFGPCHRWGDWTSKELYINAKMATLAARRGVWRCTSDLHQDGYGRILWDCPDLAVELIRMGLAHAMTVTAQPSAERYLVPQRAAIAERRGMWAHGVPPYILTSVHSNDEGYSGRTYNRLVSTTDGHSEKWYHLDVYDECQEICHETGACFTYANFRRRYGPTRASCFQ